MGTEGEVAVKASLALVVIGLGFGAVLASACADDPPPWEIATGAGPNGSGNNGSGNSGAGATGAAGPSGPGSGAGTGEGGNPPPPVFDLPCGSESCTEGQECCLDEIAGDACTAAGQCMGIPLGCDDQDDCNAGGGEPEVCCAIFEMDVFSRAECTHKGGCVGAGRTVVCKDTDDCVVCAPEAGLPDGWQSCGPPG